MSDPRLKSYEDVRKPKKPAAKGSRFPERRQPTYVAWFRAQKLPCLCSQLVVGSQVGPCRGAIEAAHVKSRGAGGEDADNLVPLCAAHHAALHRIGQRSFEFHIGQKLKPIAKRIGSAFYAEQKHGG